MMPTDDYDSLAKEVQMRMAAPKDQNGNPISHDLGGEEPDQMEEPQEDAHPALTRPGGMMQKTNESLSLLGAGSEYKNMNK
jgi:hypothetical protein